MSVVDVLVDPLLSYGFMRAGLAAAVLVGLVCAVLSCLLVVRQQALLGDAISHAVLLGVALGYLLADVAGVLPGALAIALLTGVAITYVERNSPVKLDAAMGICFTAAFALGLAIISLAQPRGIDLFHVLFGNVLGISGADLLLIVVSAGLVLTTVVVLFRPLHVWTFDPVIAQSMGVRTGVLEYVYTALLSATIVASVQTVGLLLVVAMLITPGATALMLTTRLKTMMAVSALTGVVAAIIGLYGSFYVNVASGPAIVLVVTACFAAAFAFAPRGGLVARGLARHRRRMRTFGEDILKALTHLRHGKGVETVAWAEIARPGAVSASGVRRRLRDLARADLVELHDGAVTLTEAGLQEGLRIIRTHRLLESYAHEVEGMPLPALHGVAEHREHVVDPEQVADLEFLLGDPERDPHGHPIAGLEIPSPSGGQRLSTWAIGYEGRVVMIADDRDDLVVEMVRYGLVPDAEVQVRERRPRGEVRVRIDGREVWVPAAVAQRVTVEPADPSAAP